MNGKNPELIIAKGVQNETNNEEEKKLNELKKKLNELKDDKKVLIEEKLIADKKGKREINAQIKDVNWDINQIKKDISVLEEVSGIENILEDTEVEGKSQNVIQEEIAGKSTEELSMGVEEDVEFEKIKKMEDLLHRLESKEFDKLNYEELSNIKSEISECLGVKVKDIKNKLFIKAANRNKEELRDKYFNPIKELLKTKEQNGSALKEAETVDDYFKNCKEDGIKLRIEEGEEKTFVITRIPKKGNIILKNTEAENKKEVRLNKEFLYELNNVKISREDLVNLSIDIKENRKFFEGKGFNSYAIEGTVNNLLEKNKDVTKEIDVSDDEYFPLVKVKELFVEFNKSQVEILKIMLEIESSKGELKSKIEKIEELDLEDLEKIKKKWDNYSEVLNLIEVDKNKYLLEKYKEDLEKSRKRVEKTISFFDIQIKLKRSKEEETKKEVLNVEKLNNLSEIIKDNKDFFAENKFNTDAMQGNIDIALDNIKNEKETSEDLYKVLKKAIGLAERIKAEENIFRNISDNVDSVREFLPNLNFINNKDWEIADKFIKDFEAHKKSIESMTKEENLNSAELVLYVALIKEITEIIDKIKNKIEQAEKRQKSESKEPKIEDILKDIPNAVDSIEKLGKKSKEEKIESEDWDEFNSFMEENSSRTQEVYERSDDGDKFIDDLLVRYNLEKNEDNKEKLKDILEKSVFISKDAGQKEELLKKLMEEYRKAEEADERKKMIEIAERIRALEPEIAVEDEIKTESEKWGDLEENIKRLLKNKREIIEKIYKREDKKEIIDLIVKADGVNGFLKKFDLDLNVDNQNKVLELFSLEIDKIIEDAKKELEKIELNEAEKEYIRKTKEIEKLRKENKGLLSIPWEDLTEEEKEIVERIEELEIGRVVDKGSAIMTNHIDELERKVGTPKEKKGILEAQKEYIESKKLLIGVEMLEKGLRMKMERSEKRRRIFPSVGKFGKAVKNAVKGRLKYPFKKNEKEKTAKTISETNKRFSREKRKDLNSMSEQELTDEFEKVLEDIIDLTAASNKKTERIIENVYKVDIEKILKKINSRDNIKNDHNDIKETFKESRRRIGELPNDLSNPKEYLNRILDKVNNIFKEKLRGDGEEVPNPSEDQHSRDSREELLKNLKDNIKKDLEELENEKLNTLEDLISAAEFAGIIENNISIKKLIDKLPEYSSDTKVKDIISWVEKYKDDSEAKNIKLEDIKKFIDDIKRSRV